LNIISKTRHYYIDVMGPDGTVVVSVVTE